MRQLFFIQLSVLFFLQSCGQAKQTETVEAKQERLKTDSTLTLIPGLFLADSVDTTLCMNCPALEASQLQFTEIDRAEFLRYKKKHPDKLRIDSSLIEVEDSFFSLRTAKAQLRYKRGVQ